MLSSGKLVLSLETLSWVRIYVKPRRVWCYWGLVNWWWIYRWWIYWRLNNWRLNNGWLIYWRLNNRWLVTILFNQAHTFKKSPITIFIATNPTKLKFPLTWTFHCKLNNIIFDIIASWLDRFQRLPIKTNRKLTIIKWSTFSSTILKFKLINTRFKTTPLLFYTGVVIRG